MPTPTPDKPCGICGGPLDGPHREITAEEWERKRIQTLSVPELVSEVAMHAGAIMRDAVDELYRRCETDQAGCAEECVKSIERFARYNVMRHKPKPLFFQP